uniref:Nodule-specific cysteine-rich peptide L10 n=1 Tax=Lens culinaris TaxID=3864 RepID=A0A7T8DV86_LENCU|nr:nodule-specific cysteine-rich peptide L10 [Lens culinaris]
MAEILKFVYAIILFLSLFHLSASQDITGRPCTTDADCPVSLISRDMLRTIFLCIKGVCTKFTEVP